MTLEDFATIYFTFLLSGNAEDFKKASEAFAAALSSGFGMDALQGIMDESHQAAELLCLLIDKEPLEGKDLA